MRSPGRTGSSSGTGSGGALNEFASLRGELRRGAPLELMRVATSLERPLYLRTKVLDRYQIGGFSSTSDDFTEDVDRRLTAPRQQPRLQERIFTNIIRLTDNYRDDQLPVYYWPSQITGLGNSWKYDDEKAVVGRRDGLPLDVWLRHAVRHSRAPKALSTADTAATHPDWVQAPKARVALRTALVGEEPS